MPPNPITQSKINTRSRWKIFFGLLVAYLLFYAGARLTDRIVFYRGGMLFGKWQSGGDLFFLGNPERYPFFRVSEKYFGWLQPLALIEARIFGHREFDDQNGSRNNIRGRMNGKEIRRERGMIPSDFIRLETWFEHHQHSDKESYHSVFRVASRPDMVPRLIDLAARVLEPESGLQFEEMPRPFRVGQISFPARLPMIRSSGDMNEWCQIIYDADRGLVYVGTGVDD